MMEKESRFMGSLFGKGAGYAGAVWDKDDISPTLTTMQGGLRQPLIIVDDLYANREPRVYEIIAPTLRSERIGLKVVDK